MDLLFVHTDQGLRENYSKLDMLKIGKASNFYWIGSLLSLTILKIGKPC